MPFSVGWVELLRRISSWSVRVRAEQPVTDVWTCSLRKNTFNPNQICKTSLATAQLHLNKSSPKKALTTGGRRDLCSLESEPHSGLRLRLEQGVCCGGLRCWGLLPELKLQNQRTFWDNSTTDRLLSRNFHEIAWMLNDFWTFELKERFWTNFSGLLDVKGLCWTHSPKVESGPGSDLSRTVAPSGVQAGASG